MFLITQNNKTSYKPSTADAKDKYHVRSQGGKGQDGNEGMEVRYVSSFVCRRSLPGGLGLGVLQLHGKQRACSSSLSTRHDSWIFAS